MQNINWEEVETKISIILRKFENLSRWHDDLAQELRIHAYYKSDDYYDLYRKAIDFWRSIQAKQTPEIPYFDLELLGQTAKDSSDMNEFDEMVQLIREELCRPGYNKWDNDMLSLARDLLEVIVSDIDHRNANNGVREEETISHYRNQRLNLTWISESRGIGYKRVVGAMKCIEDIVRGLSAMNKIDLPEEYFKGYYDV